MHTRHHLFTFLSNLVFGFLLVASIAYGAAGDLDTDFGEMGLVQTDMGSSVRDGIGSIALQSDGKIVAVGSRDDMYTDSAIARYNPDGTLDTSFSGDGRQVYQLSVNDDSFSRLIILDDGSMILAGATDVDPDADPTDFDGFLYKIKSNGDVDTSFGTSGLTVTPLGNDFEFFAKLFLLPDGKIIAVGFSIDTTTQTTDIALVRYHSNGSLDTDFGVGGTAFTPLSDAFLLLDAELDPAGGIIVSGVEESPSLATGLLYRFDMDGNQDLSFGTGGVAYLDPGAGIHTGFSGMTLQGDGKIVVGGLYVGSLDSDILVARFLADGSPDPDFGPTGTGFVHTDISAGSDDQAMDVAIQADGKIVVVGNDEEDMVVLRYLADGSLDDQATFADDGIQLIDFPDGERDRANAVLIQDDGYILVGGVAGVAGATTDFGLARLEAADTGSGGGCSLIR